jgi:hypothetical protein
LYVIGLLFICSPPPTGWNLTSQAVPNYLWFGLCPLLTLHLSPLNCSQPPV